MDKYKIKIKGMHCNACKILITETLEEKGLQQVEINLEENKAVFEGKNNVQNILDIAFAELKDYQYSNLKKIE